MNRIRSFFNYTISFNEVFFFNLHSFMIFPDVSSRCIDRIATVFFLGGGGGGGGVKCVDTCTLQTTFVLCT